MRLFWDGAMVGKSEENKSVKRFVVLCFSAKPVHTRDCGGVGCVAIVRGECAVLSG